MSQGLEITGFQDAKTVAKELWNRITGYFSGSALPFCETDPQRADEHFEKQFPELVVYGFCRTNLQQILDHFAGKDMEEFAAECYRRGGTDPRKRGRGVISNLQANRDHFAKAIDAREDTDALIYLVACLLQEATGRERRVVQDAKKKAEATIRRQQEAIGSLQRQLAETEKSESDWRDYELRGEVGFHPFAELFPLVEGEDFQKLKEDIRLNNGLQQPVVTYQGKILDGRNRYLACKTLGMDRIPAREWMGESSDERLIMLVLSLNLHRRHLTSQQRAAIAVEVLPLLEKAAKERQREGGAKGGKRSGETRSGSQAKVVQKIGEASATAPQGGRSDNQAAQLLRTNPEYVRQVKKVKEASPRLFEQVRQGKIKIGQATAELKKKEEREHKAKQGLIPSGQIDQRTGTAYHEAGHAVVGYLLGAGIKEVTIRPEKGDKRKEEKGTLGHYKKEVSLLPQWQVVISLAGPLAEEECGSKYRLAGSDRESTAVLLEHGHPLQFRRGSQSVWTEGDCVVSWSESTRQAYRDWLRKATKDIVTDRDVWAAISALAKRLLEVEYLDGPAAKKIIDPFVCPCK